MLILVSCASEETLHVNSLVDMDDELSIEIKDARISRTCYLRLIQVKELRDHLNFILEKYNGL